MDAAWKQPAERVNGRMVSTCIRTVRQVQSSRRVGAPRQEYRRKTLHAAWRGAVRERCRAGGCKRFTQSQLRFEVLQLLTLSLNTLPQFAHGICLVPNLDCSQKTTFKVVQT